jgi:hypothetical protein
MEWKDVLYYYFLMRLKLFKGAYFGRDDGRETRVTKSSDNQHAFVPTMRLLVAAKQTVLALQK